jgi:hypothetical protein
MEALFIGLMSFLGAVFVFTMIFVFAPAFMTVRRNKMDGVEKPMNVQTIVAALEKGGVIQTNAPVTPTTLIQTQHGPALVVPIGEVGRGEEYALYRNPFERRRKSKRSSRKNKYRK